MSFAQDGYEVVNLIGYGLQVVREARQKLQGILGGAIETYHERVPNEDLERHAKALEVVKDIPKRIIKADLPYFQWLVGIDLHLQARPFLRIARPGIATDNIGLHRDTWYGDTPYEISVWIPLTETNEGSALRVAPGSHVWSEKEYPVERFERPDVEKGSAKHALGFIYNPPKRLVKEPKTIPLPVKPGQMIVFSLALLHGQKVNTSVLTRVSMDCRLANSLAPIALARSRDANYYERLSISPVTSQAIRYAEANK